MNAESGQVGPAGAGRRPPFVIIHLMKTGGFTLVFHVLANVAQDAVWGVPEEGDALAHMRAYSSVEAIRSLPPGSLDRYRVVMGHLPFAVVDAVDLGDAPVATVLRHPVDRVISYLSMCQAGNVEHRGRPLEEIYEDVYFRKRLFWNHQTKMLGMTVEQATTRPLDPAAQMLAGSLDVWRAAGLFESREFLATTDTARFSLQLVDTPLV